MKRKILSALLALVLVASLSLVTAVPVAAQDAVPDRVTAITTTADRLVALQSPTDYGWDWVVSELSAHSGNPSAFNMYGVVILGLLDAYGETDIESYLNAATGMANHMTSNLEGDASAGDFYKQGGEQEPAGAYDYQFLMRYADVSGNTVYSEYAIALWAWNREHTDIFASPSALNDALLEWAGSDLGAAAWQLAAFGEASRLMGDGEFATGCADLIAADLDPETGLEWLVGDHMAIAECLEFLSELGSETYSSTIKRIITDLVAAQKADGCWDDGYAGTFQDTVYAVRALAVYGGTDGLNAARKGAAWLIANQLPNGGWIDDSGGDLDEFSEQDAEGLRALVATEAPVTIAENGYYSIQSAIDSATEGDTIDVAAGTYDEHITIDRSNLNLIGADKETTIIDATQDSSWDVAKAGILIGEYPLVDGVHGVTVSGFTIQNAAIDETGEGFGGNKYGPGPGGLCGVQIYNSSNNIIENNIFSNDYWQVWLVAEWPAAGYTECMNNRIANNIIQNSENDGVYLYSDGGVFVQDTEITQNEISNAYGENASGIEFWGWPEGGDTPTISGTLISGNNISDCTYGVRIREDVSDITGTSVNFNNFADNPVQLLDATETLVIEDVLANNFFDRAVTVDHEGASLLHTIWSYIQAAIDAASPSDTISVAAGTYAETVTIAAGLDNLTLQGAGPTNTVITNGIKFDTSADDDDIAGVSILNFTIRGNAGTYGNGVTVGHIGSGYIYDLTFDNNVFDGQESVGMCSYINPVAGDFTFTNNEVTGYTDWGVLYVGEATLDAGPEGPSLSTVTFQGNSIHDNMGSSVVYGNADNFTDQFIIQDNEFRNNGGHEWFWAAIEMRNVDNVLVENNLFEGSPVGMEGVHGAGLYLTNDNDGLFSGSITWNQFINNWQGIYVFSGDVGGLSVHLNNFLGNDMGIEIGTEATVLGTLDATNNWWGNASGPQPPGTYESYGDKVSANVTYEPWLLESGGATYDKTLALKDGWTLVSTDKAVADSASVGNVLALKYTTAFGEAFLADLAPLTAIYVKTVGGGGVGINYQDAAPEIYSKELGAGWNLIGTTSSAITANALLSQLRYTTVGTQQWVGLTTLVSQGDYNQFSDDFYLATLTDTDWDALAPKTLEPFDGYWAYMEAAETFEVMP